MQTFLECLSNSKASKSLKSSVPQHDRSREWPVTEICGCGICPEELISVKFIGNPQLCTSVVLMEAPLVQTEKDRHSSTKKSLCVNGVSQSWMGRKQAEKATLLETWTLSSEIGRMTQRMEPGAQGQSQEPLRTIFREQNSFLIKLLMTCTKQISQPLWHCQVPSV